VSIVDIQLSPANSVANGEFGYIEYTVVERDTHLVADLDLPTEDGLST